MNDRGRPAGTPPDDNLADTMYRDLGDELSKWAHKDWNLVISSKNAANTVKLKAPDLILGSCHTCDIVVEERGIAGNHLVFIRENTCLRVINVSGKKNVNINGQPAGVKDAIKPGDTITVKNCVIKLEEG